MYRELIDVEHALYWTVDDFFGDDECAQLVTGIEKEPQVTATIADAAGGILAPDVRNNTRVIYDDEAFAASLWPRIEPHVPPRLLGAVPVGVNERFRCYRYAPGQSFAPHHDGAFVRNAAERSLLTFMVYLNEGMRGGDTIFHDIKAAVRPRRGRALLFQHAVLHEGSLVCGGLKYVMRSDIMYRAVDDQVQPGFLLHP